jgi:hypothetical protein
MLQLPWVSAIRSHYRAAPSCWQGAAKQGRMNDPVPPKPVCRQCAAALDADDNYCRRCGQPTAVGVSLGVAPRVTQPGVWESPWVILPLIFFVLGPLALPLLWRSRRFTLLWKCILTVSVTGLTVFLVWTTWVTVERTLAPVQKALDFQL